MAIDKGMNVAEVRALAQTLQVSADKIEAQLRTLDQLVKRAAWSGPVANKFKSQWWPGHRSTMTRMAVELRDFSRSARTNADDQDTASGSTSGAGSAGSPGDLASTAALLLALKERYEDTSAMADILKHWDDLPKEFRIKDLLNFSRKIDFGNAVGAGLWGVDVARWVDAWDEQSGFDSARDGVGLAIDGAGVAVWQVAAAKFTWDTSFWLGGKIGDFAEEHWDVSSAFEASVIARTGHAPTPEHYAGAGGLVNYVTDGFKNAFSPKAWGF